MILYGTEVRIAVFDKSLSRWVNRLQLFSLLNRVNESSEKGSQVTISSLVCPDLGHMKTLCRKPLPTGRGQEKHNQVRGTLNVGLL
jgi:hypothetical protein